MNNYQSLSAIEPDYERRMVLISNLVKVSLGFIDLITIEIKVNDLVRGVV